jgi:hypothetical protein
MPQPETPEYHDTFEVSLSAILLGGSITIAIGDTLFGCIAIDNRDTFRQYHCIDRGICFEE